MTRKRVRAVPTGPHPSSPQMVEDAIEALLVYFTVTDTPIHIEDLLSRDMSRDPYVVKVKAIVMFFLKTECHLSYVTIGERFERDHTSVLNLVRRVHDFVTQEDLTFVTDYVKLRLTKQAKARQAALMAEVAG